jgi:protein SCO1/2
MSMRIPGSAAFPIAFSAAASLAVASIALADHDGAGAAEHAEHAEHSANMEHGAMDHADHSTMDHTMAGDSDADEHAAHQAMLAAPSFKRTQESYVVPDLRLTNQHGQAIDLQTLLGSDKPLAINFIFTTCTTICPVLTATWVQLEEELANDPIRPELISISIDPAYDTPAALHAYAELFGASWTFLTGTESDIARTLNVFDASRGSKVNHFALTIMRPAHSDTWTRVEGLTSARALAQVWREIIS